MLTRILRGMLLTSGVVAVLALPSAAFAEHDCGRGPCPDCIYSPGGTACFNQCYDEVCNYVYCTCDPDGGIRVE